MNRPTPLELAQKLSGLWLETNSPEYEKFQESKQLAIAFIAQDAEIKDQKEHIKMLKECLIAEGVDPEDLE